jgi:two-component system cell cycle sensor histidine kinase/response regulator CckA
MARSSSPRAIRPWWRRSPGYLFELVPDRKGDRLRTCAPCAGLVPDRAHRSSYTVLRNSVSTQRWTAGTRLGGAAVTLIGAVALLGWRIGARSLAAGSPGYIPVAPNTAALLVLLGTSVVLLTARFTSARLIARAAIAVSFVVAVAHLTEHATGVDVGVDRLVFSVARESFGRAPVGRISFFTALAFVLVCPALFVQTLRRRPRMADDLAGMLALVVTLIGVVFSLGYVYHAPLLYGDARIPMALPTAIAFVVLGLTVAVPAALRARAEERQRDWDRAHIDGAFEHAALGIALVAPDGRWLRVNRALCEIVGYSEAELLATTFQAITHPDDMDADLALLNRMLAGEIQTYQMEKRYFHRQGHVIWVLLSVSLSRDADETPRYFISQVQDITERKRAETELLRQAVVFETIGDAVLVMDLTGRIMDWNPAATRLFGYTRAEMLGRAVATVHDPDLEGRLEDEIQAALRSHHRWAGELPFQRKDGSRGLADVLVVTELDEKGQPVAWIGVNRDATERVEADRALRRAHATVAALLDAAPLAILALDVESRVTMWNPGAERLFGWRADEVLGRPLPVVSEDYMEEYLQRRDEVLGGRRVSGVETRRRRKDGSLVDVLLSTAPLQDGSGTTNGVVALLLDVTERRELEEQLRQSQRLEAVGQLAGGVAHDFNNLLTVITSYAALLLEDLDPSHPRRNDVQEIVKAADRAASLTQQLLAFGRRQLLQPRVLDVNHTVTELQRMLRRLLTTDIELVTVLDPDLCSVRADPGQLEQVLMNLVVNARDAMPDGGTVTIETANVEIDDGSARRHGSGVKPGSYVRLAVSDTGHGMDEDTQAHIFEPFFTTKEAGKGTGLGLSTVYGIVTQSGGFVSCASERGRGASFKVFLPQVDGPAEPGSGVGRAATPRGKESVLVVEDDDAVRSVAKQILSKHGYVVLEAADGAAALRLYAATSPPVDLILTDVIMPEMSGSEMARQLRERHPAVRVLYMSGYTGEAARRQRMLERGAECIEKPFTPEALTAKVREMLDGSAPSAHLLHSQ